MRIVRRLLTMPLALAAMLPVAQAVAREDSPDSGVTIDHQTLHRQVWHFVNAVMQNDGGDQLGQRFGDYCPSVIGLDPQSQAIVLDKIREAAAATGVLVEAKPGCTPDLVVAFTPNGDASAEDLYRNRGELFAQTWRSLKRGWVAQFSPVKTRELFGSGRSIRWWYTSFLQNQMKTSGSRIATAASFRLAESYVLVDVTKAAGYPLDAIASYAAMVSFAQIEGSGPDLSNAPSVLGMLSRPRQAALRDLTQWDRAYLYAAYHIPLDRNLKQQRDSLANIVSQQLAVGG